MSDEYRLNIMRALLNAIMYDLAVLSGDIPGPSYQSWQDVSKTLSTNMRKYADILDQIPNDIGTVYFPDFNDAIGEYI